MTDKKYDIIIQGNLKQMSQSEFNKVKEGLALFPKRLKLLTTGFYVVADDIIKSVEQNKLENVVFTDNKVEL